MPRTCAVLAALIAAGPATAEGWDAARFDPPGKVETATDVAAKQITYTIYADLVVRESDTDTPDPAEATLVPLSGRAAPDCAAAYRADKTPRDADSIGFFPVRLAWTGSLAVAASGPVQCRPTP